MKLIAIDEIKAKIILESGLHIGEGDSGMRIGGTDNTVVRHPHTQEPYIPGSSIKGKVRSLLELSSGLMRLTDGKPLSAKNCKNLKGQEKEICEAILKLFGCGGSDGEDAEGLGPTRLSFADCPLNGQWRAQAEAKRWPLVEVKSENSINRIKGTAENPRLTERVPAGAEFDFSVSIKRFEREEDGGSEDLLPVLLKGLRLLVMDALGKSGSRGYGRIRFEFEDQAVNQKFQSLVL
ncbi:MAG: type III-A CRISPR-associated RAMP protein Csm3 [Desulfatibacillaceae bacterium]|nr:type III-A CRISPR-associated RAMP protein Csm3 [Desulfatibacillaceae bacterium]